jgi:hypothetical protein
MVITKDQYINLEDSKHPTLILIRILIQPDLRSLKKNIFVFKNINIIHKYYFNRFAIQLIYFIK